MLKEKSRYYINVDHTELIRLSEILSLNGIESKEISIIPDSYGFFILSLYMNDQDASFVKLASPTTKFFNYTRIWGKPKEPQ